MKPSTLLKKASKLGKKQTYGMYRDTEGEKYCAVGVMGCLLNKYTTYNALDGTGLIQELANDISNIDFGEEFGFPYRHNLFSVIIMLNDEMSLTFNEIADFLKVSCGL